jgi:hypothetical protein
LLNIDRELIERLSEQISKETSTNIDLSTKLKIAEGEIENYKKILFDYQSELSQMKVRNLNEIKNEFLKENERTRKPDSQQQQMYVLFIFSLT